MKSVKDWVKKLPAEYRLLARKSMIKPDLIVNSMSNAIRFGFNFPEKDKYFWLDISDHYLLGTPLPEMPNKKRKIAFIKGDGSVNSPFWQDGDWEELKINKL